MLKNYFFLNRLTAELNGRLKGFRVLSAFTQEKDILMLECRKKEEALFLEISVNPLLPYIVIRERFNRAKKNVADIFQGYFPSEIREISIAEFDRIIKINFDEQDLVFYLRGSRTNIAMISPNSVSFFKKTNDKNADNVVKEITGKNFITSFVSFKTGEDLKENPAKQYPFLGKEIIAEAGLRNPVNPAEGINSVVSEIEAAKPVIYSSDSEIRLSFENFLLYRDGQKEEFDSFNDALTKYLVKKHSGEYLEKRKDTLVQSVQKELERTASRLNNLRGRIEKGSREEEYNKTANLLLINMHRIIKGSEKIVLEDIYTDNSEAEIKIDPSVSPKKNVDRYFEKARSERINYIKSKELYESSVKKYNQLKEKLDKLNRVKTAEDLRLMDNQKNKPADRDKDDLKSKFRQYLIDGKYMLFIGRDSQKNDLLTMKFAKQNDYWFHARGVPGSHAVLRVDNTKEPVPKPVLKKAAAIAAYHSKAKTASMAPVSYTLKKYVTKKKGMEPGKVSLMKEDVLLVKPEIPAGVEYLTPEE